MKNPSTVKNLKKIGIVFSNKKTAKKANIDNLINEVIFTMNEIGGITGIITKSHGPISLQNHENTYTIPIRMESYDEITAQGKRTYEFFERLVTEYHNSYELNKNKVEFHLGKNYSSKHHQPEWFKSL